VSAPNGTTLRRYEIKAGETFPSNRSVAEERQNFANWFQYYRKRRLMLAGAMGTVMENIGGLRLGAVAFNNRSGVTMYDADASNNAINRLRIAGFFYENNNSGGTPTRETLAYIGNHYTNTAGVVQYACQRNNAFIVTDGFANVATVSPPSYDASTWGSGAPYQTTYQYSLADIALSYYTNNLKPTMTAGRVPASQADANPNLHMNTYGLTLGVRGTIYQGEGTPLPTSPSAWPQPNQNRSPTAVDDLWHATINGRGQKYIGSDAATTAARITDGLNDMLENVGAQSSVAVSSVNLRRGDGKAYLGTYTPRGWSGDITANAVNASTGVISATPLWSASTRLLAKNWTTRVIATSVNGAGVPFTAANVGSIVNPGGTYGTDADVVNYLRGERANENTVPAVFRRRLSLISAVINARPAVSGPDRVVYAASSEGMLHALDADTGEELWAYVPGSALAEIGAQTRRTWSFETYLDGSPQIFTVGTRTLLIGGRGAAGAGYYALDVTNPRSITSEAALASKVLWEFPASQGLNTAGNAAVGVPLLVQTASGPVALITQGYSTATDAASARDGRVRLWALNALSGSVARTFSVASGPSGTNPGLAQVTGLVQADGTVRYVYGGDELGKLWRFDLQTGAALTLASLVDAGGNAQPITAAPSLVSYRGSTIVLVGTGRLLDLSDFGSTAQRSFYAIKDTGALLANPRSDLVARTLTAEANGERSIANGGAEVDWSTGRGWYLDLPAGQEANTEPAALFGAAVFTTNAATMTDCSTSSYLYVLDILSGRNFTPSDGNTSYAMARIGDFTVSSVMAMGYDGRGSSDFGFTFQRSTTSPTGTGSPRVQCSGSACKSDPPIKLPDMRRKNSWRQVQRN
jgi:type IV pilus assembly protein PilY1